MAEHPDMHPKVWMCMVSFRWSHHELAKCSSPTTHRNCGWHKLEKVELEKVG